MEYILITLLAIAATTCLVYLLANKVFAVRLRLKSLVLCAACALFLSLVLPRIVVSFAGLAGTVGFLALFAVIFAYFVAYYDEPKDLQPAGNAPPANPPLQSDEPSPMMDEPPAYAASPGLTTPQAEPDPIIITSVNIVTDDSASAEPVYAAATAETEDVDTVGTDDLLPAHDVSEPLVAQSEAVSLAEPVVDGDQELSLSLDESLELDDSQPPLDPLASPLYGELAAGTEVEPEAEPEVASEALTVQEPETPITLATELESEPDSVTETAASTEPEPEPQIDEVVQSIEAEFKTESDAETGIVPELGILLEPFTATEPEPDSEAVESTVDIEPEPQLETEPEQPATPETESEPPQTADDQAASLELEIELNLIAGPVAGAETEQDDETGISLPPAPSLDSEPPPVADTVEESASGLEAEAESLATLALAGPDDADVGSLPETNLAQPESQASEGEGSAEANADDEPLTEESEVTAIAEPISNNLDDLLDFAFSQKDSHNLPLALDTFRRAFKLYRDSEAGPLLVVEIAGLLKAKGAYDEAVVVLSDGRSLAALQQNSLLDQEFVTTIAYLRIVKNTLMQNRIGFVPFQRIPADVAKEIDDEFREWRNLA